LREQNVVAYRTNDARRGFQKEAEKPMKTFNIQELALSTTIRRTPTETPLFGMSNAGECDFRETAFFGISCMVW
jgi:hypothetical protein